MRHVLERSSARARRRVVAVGAVVLVGLLAGCTGEEPVEPDPSSSTTESPEPTEEPEPTPTETGPVKPERPAAMDQQDGEGAAAAAEYFLELYPYVMATGDTAEWEAMAHEACGFCDDAIGQAETIKSRADVYSGGETDVVVVGEYARDDLTGIFPLDARVDQTPIVITDSAGGELFASDALSKVYRAEMGIRDGAWVVVEVAPAPAG